MDDTARGARRTRHPARGQPEPVDATPDALRSSPLTRAPHRGLRSTRTGRREVGHHPYATPTPALNPNTPDNAPVPATTPGSELPRQPPTTTPSNNGQVTGDDAEDYDDEDVDDDMDMGQDPDDEDAEDDFNSETTNAEENPEPMVPGEEDGHYVAASVSDGSGPGLKEISNLAKFTVSSYKPGNGVNELRNDDLKQYWQSDGPQPHRLTIYFIKRVGIRDIRFYVDHQEDESYTPTKIIWKAGTSENNLIDFAVMELTSPAGWQQVPNVSNCGGGDDGATLYAWVLQMQILENHQNGKDTHLRGIKIYAQDLETGAVVVPPAAPAPVEHQPSINTRASSLAREASEAENRWDPDRLEREMRAMGWRLEEDGSNVPAFMREPELR